MAEALQEEILTDPLAAAANTDGSDRCSFR